MRWSLLWLSVAVSCGGSLAAQAPTDEFLHLEPVLQAAIRKVTPSVVTIETFGGTRRLLAGGGSAVPDDAPSGPGEKPPEKKPPEKKPDEEKKDEKLPPLQQAGFLQAQGSTTGVVLTSDGWIAVSRFALNYDPSTILVTTADGKSYHARRGGEDTSRGLALVKIDAQDLIVPEFVPPDAARVGQWTFVLGRTFGQEEPSVHMGILSAVGRLFGRALQTDAYTSPANYGGPMIDIQGRVLGISVPLSRSGRDAGAELYDSGIGFASTIADIMPLLSRMKAGETLHRGWLGVSTVTTYLGPGARLAQVAENSAAAAAGLERGDLILSVDTVDVRNSFHLQSLISSKMGGDPVHLKVGRKSGTVGITVFLKDLPESERQPQKPAEEAGVLPWEEEDKKK